MPQIEKNVRKLCFHRILLKMEQQKKSLNLQNLKPLVGSHTLKIHFSTSPFLRVIGLNIDVWFIFLIPQKKI